MKKEEIFLSDWYRILFGNTPMEFMLEVFFRTLIVYIALVVVMRLLGKRMNGQLTIIEFAVMLTLGAIVAVPFQIPERGIAPSLVVLVCALVFHRGLNWLSFKYRKVEKVAQGDLCILVHNGVINRSALEANRISKDQLFAQLRDKSIRHLGQVKRVYMEACGLFSVFTEAETKPGLSVLPEKDQALLKQEPVDDQVKACSQCGNIIPTEKAREANCPNCGCEEWTNAIK
ncbi:YetF domain-containing protein [Adhaeribacter aquaticus]|uniref:YetF domain-containing protein n=1 Tax=Adhaeribacter aquaticus TaxID=299567 RepID=UPI00047C72F9|nr:YetF domain-containing protein [Adhaeribacter aquaticus]